MGPDYREPVLSGLVSRAAQDLYSKLQAHGALRIGIGPNEVDPTSAAAVELLEAGVVFRSGDSKELVRPVSPPTALQLLLKAQHARLGELQQTLLDGWSRLNGLLPTTVGGSSPAGAGLDLIDDVSDITRLAAEFYHAPRHRLRGTETGELAGWITENRIVMPPRAQQARYQMIYSTSYTDTRTGTAIIARSATAGVGIRLRHSIRLKMLHVDDAVARKQALSFLAEELALELGPPITVNALAGYALAIAWGRPSAPSCSTSVSASYISRIATPLSFAARRRSSRCSALKL